MGTDIHAVLEYRNEFGDYRALASGELNISRDYSLFNAIAFGEDGIIDELPFSPRGLPPDSSDLVRDQFLIDADEYSEAFEILRDDDHSAIDNDQVCAGLPRWMQEEYRDRNRLPNPDFHTASWLTLSEFEKSLGQAGLTLAELGADMRAVVAAIRELVGAFGDSNVKPSFLVRWVT